MVTRNYSYKMFDGLKSVNINSLPEEAWRTLTGGDREAELYQSVAYFARAIDLIASSVSKLPIEYTNMAGDAIDEPDRDYIEELPTLLYQIAVSMTVYGYAYLFRRRNRVRTLGLQWMAPRSITPKYDQQMGLSHFNRVVGNSTTRLEVDDVVYFWQPPIEVETGPGQPKSAAAITAAQLLHSVNQYSTAFFERGAVFPMLLTIDGSPSVNEIERLESWWKRLVRGVASAWETIAVRAAVKPEIIGPPVSDMAMPELTDIARQDIATALGVPHSLVMSNAANYATAQQDYINLYDLTVIPLANRIAQAFNVQAFRREGFNINFKPEQLPVFQTANLADIDKLTTAVNSGILTADEARDILGYEPLEVVPETEPEPEAESEPEPQEDEEPDIMKFRRKALKSGIVTFDSPEVLDAPIITAALGHCYTKAAIDNLFADYLEGGVKAIINYSDNVPDYQLDYERDFAPDMQRFLQAEARAIAEYYDANGELPPATEERNNTAAFLVGALTVWILAEIGKQADGLGTLPVTADVNALAAEWANTHALELAKRLTDTTRALAKQAIAKHLRENGATNLQKLVSELEGVIAPKWRAEMIAQTEISRAINAATDNVAKELTGYGLDVWLVYRTAQDERVCPICAPMHGKKRRPGGKYPNGNEPPQHPRCRCREYVEVVDG